jgi:hypothetical protein
MVHLFNLRFLNLRFHYQFVLREGSWPRNTARAAGLPACCWSVWEAWCSSSLAYPDLYDRCSSSVSEAWCSSSLLPSDLYDSASGPSSSAPNPQYVPLMPSPHPVQSILPTPASLPLDICVAHHSCAARNPRRLAPRTVSLPMAPHPVWPSFRRPDSFLLSESPDRLSESPDRPSLSDLSESGNTNSKTPIIILSQHLVGGGQRAAKVRKKLNSVLELGHLPLIE